MISKRSLVGFEWYIARNYLFSPQRGRLLSFITWITLGGVTVGVTALIITIGVMSGMQEDLMGKILDSSPHVIVLKQGSSLRMDNWNEIVVATHEVKGVVGVSPLVLTNVAVSRSGYTQPADLYGVSLDTVGPAVTDIEGRIQNGIHNLETTASGLPAVILGSRLAARMSLFSGDTVTVVSFENLNVDVMGMPTPRLRQYEMTGTFTTGMYDYDIKNIYVSLEEAQGQLGIFEKNQISMLGVRTDDPDQASVIAQAIQEKLGPEFYAVSWSTTNRALFSALKLEKFAMGMILILIVIVAAFNIVSTLVMVVVDRTREIGILKSMGMTDRMILRIFVLQGLWIGVIGTILGAIIGVFLGWILDTYKIIQIPPDVYFIDKLPVSIHPMDVSMIVVISIIISCTATIYPAIQASKLQPVDAIRHE